MLTYSITEAKAKFAEVVEKAIAGENIIVTKLGRPAIQINRYQQSTEPNSRIGFMKGKCYIAEDFDELPEEIARAFGMID